MAQIVTLKEVKEYLKMTDSTIYKLASRGILPAAKIGGTWRFNMDEIVKMVTERDRRTMNTGEQK